MNPKPEINQDSSRLTVHVPLALRKRGHRKVVIAPEGQGAWAPATKPRIDSSLVKAIARAYRWRNLLEQGTYASLRDLAAAEKISPTYVSRLLKLTLLAPEVVERVLNGDAAEGQGWPEIDQLWCDQAKAVRCAGVATSGFGPTPVRQLFAAAPPIAAVLQPTRYGHSRPGPPR